MRSLILLLSIALSTLYACGEVFMRSDYNQQHVFGAYPPGTSNLNAIPRQHMGALDMPYPPEVAPGKVRLLIIGDSYTWGGAVHPSQRFADVLGREHPELEVVVLAPKGANTPMEFDLWKEYGRDVNADIVILAVSSGDNDLGFVPQPPASKDYLRLLMPESHMAAFLDDKLQPMADWYPWFEGINTDPQTLKMWGTILENFRADIEAHDAPAYALLLAQPTAWGEDYTRLTYARMETALTGAGWQTWNFLSTYEAHYGDIESKRERWASPNDSHYNAETHALIAAWLWELLRADLG